MRKIAYIAALMLAACAAPGSEPTAEATDADRQVFSRGAKFRTVCRDEMGIKPPRFGFTESNEKCDCFHDRMVQTFDGKIVAWAIQYPDWWDRRTPDWAERRLAAAGGLESLMWRAAAACKIGPK